MRLLPEQRENRAIKSHLDIDLKEVYLPVGRMLQIDHVRSIEEGVIVCEQNLLDRQWLFDIHFPDDPIFPGSFMIEGAGQAVAIWMWKGGIRGKPRLLKATAEFKSPVVPQDELLTYTAKIQKRQNICIGAVTVTVRQRLAANIEIWLAVVSSNGQRPAG